jgi:hypothetical protein
MKKLNIMKLKNCLAICLFLAMVFGCEKYSSFFITEKPFVDKTSVVLYIGASAGNRNTIQLISSPFDRKYTWTSLSPDVASVDQNGLVTAHNEGYTVIVVASENDRTEVNVRVLEFVPLTDFTLGQLEYSGVVQDLILITAMPEPYNASEMNIQWTSSNENVAIVYSNGLVKIVGVGSSIITATANDITKKVTVFSKLKFPITSINIPGEQPYNVNINTETWGYSSQQPAYPLTNLFDGNPASFWHGSYSGFLSTFPHWFILDMRATIMVTDIMMQKRQEAAGQNFRSCTGFYLYSCPDVPVDQSDPDNGYPWVFQGEFQFNSQTNAEQWYKIPSVEGRYFRIYYDTQHKDPTSANTYIQIAEFAMYGY